MPFGARIRGSGADVAVTGGTHESALATAVLSDRIRGGGGGVGRYAERLIDDKSSSTFDVGLGLGFGRGRRPLATSANVAGVVLHHHAVVDHAKGGIAVLLAGGKGLADNGTCLSLLGGGSAIVVGGRCGGSRLLALEDSVPAAAHLIGGTTVVVVVTVVVRGTGLGATCIDRTGGGRGRRGT